MMTLLEFLVADLYLLILWALFIILIKLIGRYNDARCQFLGIDRSDEVKYLLIISQILLFTLLAFVNFLSYFLQVV